MVCITQLKQQKAKCVITGYYLWPVALNVT